MPPFLSSTFQKRSAGLMMVVAVGLLGESFLPVSQAQAISTNSSFSDNIPFEDTKLAIADAVSVTEDALKEKMILQEQVRSISAALVEARQQAETAMAENRELKSRVEALGLNAVGNSRTKLEQRLVKAVSDLSGSQTQTADFKASLAGLSEAVLSLLKTSKDVSPEARLAVETELRSASQKLGGVPDSAVKAEPVATSMVNSRIISIKPELALLVGNIGSADGVKVGMPFQVYEGQQVIALVRAVDVRSNIFGALVEENLSEKTAVKVGQRLKVAVENNL